VCPDLGDTSPASDLFLTLHRLPGELVERVLDFHPIKEKEHEGEHAGAFMARRLSELQVLE
jgi:hypothetical protein